MKISFITTIYNEERTINVFLESLIKQSKMPDEIIIVDGGSNDATISLIEQFIDSHSNYRNVFKVIIKKGNRSVGRNEAINNAKGEIILCSDSGNILHKNWVLQISKPLDDAAIDVVAGYYKGNAKTVFQKSIIPYAFVMPDKVDPDTFLPATRSIAFTKQIWKKVGGFDERLSHNEDYAFAQSLRKVHARIIFAKDAIVYWIPRNTLSETYIMLLRFAYGDAEARIFRPKVMFLFIRYIIGMIFLSWAIIIMSHAIFVVLLAVVFAYILWSIYKNYKYVRHWKAFYILPLLQFTADLAVLTGTILGVFKIWDIQKTQ